MTSETLVITAQPIGSSSGGTYDGVQGLVQATYNYSAWNGTGGITTSMADAAAGLTTIAVDTAGHAGFAGATFGGVTVAADDVLLAYTYAGDINFDGLVDAADYGIIDNYYQFPGTDGYANGDFNYDGIIDAGDYGLIDNAFQLQGPPITHASPTLTAASASLGEGVQAVPEPSAATAMIAVAAGLLLRRIVYRPPAPEAAFP